MPKQKPKSPPRKRASAESFPKEPASPLISQIELRIIRTTESHTMLSITNNEIPKEFQTKIEAQVGVNPVERIIVVDVNAVVLSVQDPTNINHLDANKSTTQIQVKVQCVFGLINDALALPSITEDEAKAIQTTGIFAAYPYIRNFVSFSSTAMGIPPITMPLFRMNFQQATVVPSN